MGTPEHDVFQTKMTIHCRALLQYFFVFEKMFYRKINHFKIKLAKTSVKKKGLIDDIVMHNLLLDLNRL